MDPIAWIQSVVLCVGHMTKPYPDYDSSKRPAKTPSGLRALNDQETYICPVCRHGHISSLTLMDAFACDFCRHIFTVNLENQSIQVADSSQPMSWRWNGRGWMAAHHNDRNLTLAIWLVGIALVVLPSTIVCASAYMFPPLPDSRWAWLSAVWCGVTIVVHLGMVSWLIAEHYQIPIYVMSKIQLRRLFNYR
jgi:hypothetical protein